MGARRYQELDAWRLANELKLEVYALLETSAANEDRRFCTQVRAAASSGPANLAEGFACFRHSEFSRYARIARASLLETHNHVGDGADRRYWPPAEATRVQALAERAVGATTRLLQYLSSTDTP
jgi:four helix bundle protein